MPLYESQACTGRSHFLASAGDTVAITNVRVVNESSSVFLGTNFIPCEEAKTLVFEVPKGGVYYLVDLEYIFRGEKLNVRYGEQFEAAKQYVDATFPALKGQLQQASYQFMPNAKSCAGGTLYIPVYLPK